MTTKAKYKLGILATHPIQYYVPWYRALAMQPGIDLTVFYCHYASAQEQGKAGFGVTFDWDIPLLDGYSYQLLKNLAKRPDASTFTGCDTPEIRKIIHAENFDAFIVQGWYVKSFWQAIFACWQLGTPLFVRGDSHLLTPRSRLKERVKSVIYPWFIKRFDGYLAVGKQNQCYYLYYGANPKRLFLAPHAVDNDFFESSAINLVAQRSQLRAEREIPQDATLFLFVGKFINVKRPADFVEAIALASKQERSIYGLMVGDGPLKPGLQRYVDHHKLPIRFTGFLNQTELPSAYAMSDMLVLPSTGETWGLVVNEAMASGLPAIVSDRVGCATDLVIPDRTGIIYPMGDRQALASAMIKVTLSAKLSEMKQYSRLHINNYSIEKTVAGTVAAVQAMCAEAH